MIEAVTSIVWITSILFGLLLIPTSLRLLSKERVVFHLLLFAGMGLAANASILLADLQLLTPFSDDFYHLIAEVALLGVILSFGAMTLDFLKTTRLRLVGYWAVALVILGGWSLITFNIINLGSVTLGRLLISGFGWIFGIGVILTALILDFKQPHPTQYLNRLRYWTIATALIVVSGIILFTNPLIFGWAGLILLAGGSLLASYIVLSYHTPDLRLLIGRTARYVALMMILFVVYFVSLATMLLINRNPDYVGNGLFWSGVIALILANITVPLWGLFHQLLTGLIFGKQHQDQKQVIQHYSRSISSALDMDRLGDTILDLMIETLGIEHGIVFANQRGGSGYIALRPLSSIGLEDVELSTGRLSTASPFIDYFRQGHKILSQYDIDVLPEFREMAEEEKTWFSQLNMELFVAIIRERELIGLLAFGKQGQGATYYDEDRDLMIALADQAALAMDSARLFEQLAVINQEVGSLTNQLAGLDQGKSDFLSIASHELRTPLTHIHGYSRMLLDLTEEELSDPAYVKTIIEGIAKGSERMKGVIDLMFDVTEADVGEMNLFTGPVELEEVIDMAVRPFLSALDERRIAFGKNGLRELPTIEADGTRLVQAFENLLGNAIKYTPDGGVVTIECQLKTDEDLGDVVEAVVIDTGIGINPEHQETIFEKFFRIDDADHHSTGKTKFKGAGPGLGLTLVKGIADAHGGKVWVESLGYDEVNLPGSKFFFIIPTNRIDKTTQKQSQIETRHWRQKDRDLAG